MNVKATAKYIHMAPRKVRLVVDLVRGLSIDEARRQLMFSSKMAAGPVLKALNSAVANAQNNLSIDTTDFVVVTAFVDEGPTMHRFRPRAQGRAAAIRKRMSHVTIEVGPKGGAKSVKKVDVKGQAEAEETAVKAKASTKKKSAVKPRVAKKATAKATK